MESWSLVSISVTSVSSSGAGSSAFMYRWIDCAARWQRSENSFISSLDRTSLGGVVSASCWSKLADDLASSIRAASSSGGGSCRGDCEGCWGNDDGGCRGTGA